MRTHREKPTADELGDEALQIDLTGMEPRQKAMVEAKFRQLYRAGKLSLPVAFRIINEVEGSEELKAWNADRARYAEESLSARDKGTASGSTHFPDHLMTMPPKKDPKP